jgi:hypothetical protein
MQFDSNYGIIIDSLNTIQTNYQTAFLPTFSDATSADSPAYVISQITAGFDYQIQQALQVLWNSLNANTASGLGLDILASSILNLNRRGLIPSTAVVRFTVNLAPGGGTPTITSLTIPATWAVTTASITPSPVYTPNQSYTYNASGTYSIIVYSTDIINSVAAGALNIASSLGGYVTNVTNAAATSLGTARESDSQFAARRKYYLNVSGQTYYGLEKSILNLNIAALRSVFVAETINTAPNQRGCTVYLEYPTNGAAGNNFDINDLNLQSIAQTVYNYHPAGTNTYGQGANIGATDFTVQTPYGGYTGVVTLNPIQLRRVGVKLDFIYNVNPNDAGYNGQVFPLNTLPGLKASVLALVNNYFRSKTLPTDLMYTITELTTLIQATYLGVVDLRSFNFITYGAGGRTDLVYLRREIGFTYNLADADFAFTTINKDTL